MDDMATIRRNWITSEHPKLAIGASVDSGEELQ
jgi:hypothetical protein